MATDSSELVMVLPGDNTEIVVGKIRAAGSLQVQLLVADGNIALQQPANYARLRHLADRDNLVLTFISSDEHVLDAARQNQFDAVGVNGTHVVPGTPRRRRRPAETEPAATESVPFATQKLDTDDLDLAGEYVDNDSDFLDDLDRNAAPSYSRLDEGLDSDIDEYDEYSAPAPLASNSRYDDDVDDETYLSKRPATSAAAAEAAAARLREAGTTGTRTTSTLRSTTRPSATGAYTTSTLRRETRPVATPRGARPISFDEEETAPRRTPVVLPILIGALLVLAVAGYFLFSNRPTVLIWPSASEVKSTPVADEVIPVSQANSDAASVNAAPVSGSAEITIQGQASQQMSPVGTARGTVQIINTLTNPIDLPEGTQFIANNESGQQVGFLIDSPATVPPAVTSSSSLGTSTQFGSIEVQVSAQSTGSASNVGENSIAEMVIPGQPPIQSSGQIRILNTPLQGGTEEPLYIVTQQDVQNVLSDGLGKLYLQGQTQLRSAQMPSGYVLDDQTVFPNPQALGDPQNYEPPIVSPQIGQPAADQANPVFQVTLRANFSALATPANQPVAKQLETVTKEHFATRGGLCGSAEKPGLPVTGYTWNGQQLTINGAITCTPIVALSDAVLDQVRTAVVGQPFANANEALQQMKQAGTIGGYKLPQVDTFPPFGFFVQVQQAPNDVPNPDTVQTPVATGEPAPDQTTPQSTSEPATPGVPQ